MHRDRMAAFTLIELLVVIAIIAIIAAILFPVFARVREKARQATCQSNLRQIAMAVKMYMSDYDERFPFVLDFSGNCICGNSGDDESGPVVPGVTGQEPQFQLIYVIANYVKNANVWYCPSVGPDFVYEAAVKGGWYRKGATMRDQGTTYGYTYLVWPTPSRGIEQTFMGGKSETILREPSHWPMIWEAPSGFGFTGNIADPPLSAMPHFGGENVAYGDGHVKFHRMEVADGSNYTNTSHAGDGIYPGQ